MRDPYWKSSNMNCVVTTSYYTRLCVELKIGCRFDHHQRTPSRGCNFHLAVTFLWNWLPYHAAHQSLCIIPQSKSIRIPLGFYLLVEILSEVISCVVVIGWSRVAQGAYGGQHCPCKGPEWEACNTGWVSLYIPSWYWLAMLCCVRFHPVGEPI